MQYYLNERALGDSIIFMTVILQAINMEEIDSIKPIFVIIRLLSVFMLKPISLISNKLENIISMSNDMEIIISISGLFFKICLFLHSLSLIFTVLSQVQK